ncbi:unnamed protein product [Parajaminaea phylloscopi]
MLLLTLVLLAASTRASQCTFYLNKGCSGGTSVQPLPINYFPAYSSFSCDMKVNACYDTGCGLCNPYDAGGCNDKSTKDDDGKDVNYVCFLRR